MSSNFGPVVRAVQYGISESELDYKYDDPKDPNRFFYPLGPFQLRAQRHPDHFCFDGVHEDYHRPGDEPQKIDYDKMQRVTRTVYVTLWEIAIRPTRPKVDKQLPAGLNR